MPCEKRTDILQKIAAQSQRHGRFWLPDGLAGLLHVDVQDSFARNAFEGGLAAQRGDEPDGSDSILAVGQDYHMCQQGLADAFATRKRRVKVWTVPSWE